MPSPKIKKIEKVSSAKDFRKKREDTILDLPSGARCKVRRPGLPQLLAEGVLPDMLTPIADEAIKAGRSGKKLKKEDEQNMMADLLERDGGMDAMMDGMARITAHCVVEPKCSYHKRKVDHGAGGYDWELIPDDERDEEILYTDEVDMEDQGFIFQYVVGGSKDLTDFRKQVDESLERVDSKQSPKKDSR
jgi:hypothetical protein